MFRELVELGWQLESEGKLPPESFAYYQGSIDWTVHLWADRAVLRKSERPCPKPFSNRTVNLEANLLADEAAYCLGVSTTKEKTIDAKAPRKFVMFQELYRRFSASPELIDPDLRTAIGWLDRLLTQDRLASDPHLAEATSKQWVSFVPEEGALRGQHLFEHPDARAFWGTEKRRRCIEPALVGQCSICGSDDQRLLRMLPLQVKLGVRNPLHSLNKPAFTSYVSGAAPNEKTHIGICFACGDTASRAFDYLSDSPQHRRLLIKHPNGARDSLANQYALFWLKGNQLVQAEDQTFELAELDLGLLISDKPVPSGTLAEMRNLLNLPWKPKSSGLRLDDSGFYLALLSPNVGRIALREWMALDITRVKHSLSRYLTATEMVSPYGDFVAPVALSLMIRSLDKHDTNVTRALLRCAYAGNPPPSDLLTSAGGRLNFLIANERSLRDRQQRKRAGAPDVWMDSWGAALAGAVKLAMYWNSEEASTMTRINPLYGHASYHCGRLLAVLEEAQQVYTYHQRGERLKVSIVQRSYGGAAETPAPVLGQLFKIASTTHLPSAGRTIQIMAEEICSTIAQVGGAPARLSLAEQAEFGLGFYQQRAEIRAQRSPSATMQEASQTLPESAEPFDDEETSDEF